MTISHNLGTLLAPILNNNLSALRQLQASLNIYIALGPFTKLAIKHSDELHRLQQITLPTATANLSTLLHLYRIQPSLSITLIRPSFIGLLVHTFSEQYAENALRNLVSKCGEELNDSIRELNQLELQEPELRKCLITGRNDMEAFMTLLPSKASPSAVSKAIDWIF